MNYLRGFACRFSLFSLGWAMTLAGCSDNDSSRTKPGSSTVGESTSGVTLADASAAPSESEGTDGKTSAPTEKTAGATLPRELTDPGKPHQAAASYWGNEKKNLVLMTMDTTRADHISAYGKHPDLTPNIDEIAAGGALFLNGLSQTNQTNPSHLSVMTGLMAYDHGIISNEEQLAKDVDMLPLAFKRQGYRTAGFPSSSHVSAWLGWKGFDHIYEVEPDPKTYLNAKQVTQNAIEWLDENGDAPFFIWIHYWDPHAPYNPDKKTAEMFYPGNPKEKGKPDLRQNEAIFKNKWLTGVTDLDYPLAMYKAEVHFSDIHIGHLMDYLEKRGLSEKTGIVLVGDHGENLGEHEMYYNHYFVFEPALRVPYVIKMPGFPAGVKISENVTQIDLAPTLASLYGLDLNNPLRGINLVPSLKGEANSALAQRRVLVHEHGNDRQIVVRDGNFKIVYTITPFRQHPPLHVDAGTVWVYDVENDPEELNDLADQYPQLVDKYRGYVQKWFDWKDKIRDEPPRELDEGHKKALGELGYMDTEEDEEDGYDEAPVKKPAKAKKPKPEEDDD